MGRCLIQVGLENIDADCASHVKYKLSLSIARSSLLVRVVGDGTLRSTDRAPSWCNADQPRLWVLFPPFVLPSDVV